MNHEGSSNLPIIHFLGSDGIRTRARRYLEELTSLSPLQASWGTLGAPFYPSSPLVIEKMLTLAGVNSESTVYDLGCGDGEIVVAAARDHNAKKAVGIEQDQKLCSIALRKTRHLRNTIIINANYDDVDISEADVVMLYQSTSGNARLKRKLVKELRGDPR